MTGLAVSAAAMLGRVEPCLRRDDRIRLVGPYGGRPVGDRGRIVDAGRTVALVEFEQPGSTTARRPEIIDLRALAQVSS